MSEILSPAQVAEIRARAEKATPGPWHEVTAFIRDEEDHDLFDVATAWPWKKESGRPWTDKEEEAGRQLRTPGEMSADAEFVAASRTDIPALCDTVDAQARRIAELEALDEHSHRLCVDLASRLGAESGRALKAEAEIERLKAKLAEAESILQTAPKPWITDSNYSGPEWMEAYRRWWIRRLPGTAEIIDASIQPAEQADHTGEWKPTPYDRICAEACEWCAKGIRATDHTPPLHYVNGEYDQQAEVCTAPSRDEVIERLTAPVVRDKCPVCGDGGCSNCNINLACAELARVTKERELLQYAVDCHVKQISDQSDFINERLTEVVEYELTYETNLDGRGRPSEWRKEHYQWGDPVSQALQMLGLMPGLSPFRKPENFRNVVLERRSWLTTKPSDWVIVDPAVEADAARTAQQEGK